MYVMVIIGGIQLMGKTMHEEKWKTNFRKAFEDSSFNMRGLSREIGKGDTFVRDMFKKDTMPTIESFAKLCNALGVTPDEILEVDKGSTTAVIDAFVDLLEEMRLRDITTKIIADRAGVRARAIDSYFEDKYDILKQAGLRTLKRQNESLETWTPTQNNALGKLLDLSRFLYESQNAKTTHIRMFEGISWAWTLEEKREYRTLLSMRRRIMHSLLEDAIEAGELKSTSKLTIVLDSLWSAHLAVLLNEGVNRGREYDVDHLIDDLYGRYKLIINSMSINCAPVDPER
jgi:AcrR family transcriptional regulator